MAAISFSDRIYRKIFGYTPGSCAVLLYHRVSDYQTDPQQLCVSPLNFEKHLNILAKDYNVITIEEFSDCLMEGKRFQDKSVCITFDDGYADNYLSALPILEKNKMQALFYISTGTLNTANEFWWDALERILLLNENQSSTESHKIKSKEYNLYNSTTDDRFFLYEELLPVLRRMPSAEREEHIEALASAFNSFEGRSSHRAMTFDELAAMATSGSAVIGAHTHLHPSLGALSYQEQSDEISASRSIIENCIKKNVDHFSYPFGTISDYNDDTFDICRKLNFKTVAANYPETVKRGSNTFAFPRFLVRDWNEMQFKCNLQNFFRS